MKYVPQPIPFKVDDPLVGYVARELKSLSFIVNGPTVFEKKTVEPAKPQDGQVEYADGVNWNPGSGAGLYYYKVSAWVLIA